MSKTTTETVDLAPGQELTLRTALELKVGDAGPEVWGTRDVKMRVDAVQGGYARVTVTETPADFDDALLEAAVAGLEEQLEVTKAMQARLIQAVDDLKKLRKEKRRG